MLDNWRTPSRCATTATPLPTPLPPSPTPPCPACSLPNEIFDEILQFHFEGQTGGQNHDQDLSNVSLVCQAWHHPAQRWWFEQINLSSPTLFNSFAATIKRNPALATYVRNFVVCYDEVNEESKWTVRELLEILKLLSSLQILDLELDMRLLGIDADFSLVAELDNLSTVENLSIRSVGCDEESGVIRSFLKASPNVQCLAITDDSHEDDTSRHSPLSFTPLAPLDLPHLSSLALNSKRLCEELDSWNLLSKGTLKCVKTFRCRYRVPQVDLDSEHAANVDALHVWGTSLGPNLTYLDLGPDFTSKYIKNMVRSCPKLEILRTATPFIQLDLPSTLHTIRYHPELDPTTWFMADASWLASKGIYAPVTSWKNVKKVDLIHVPRNMPMEKLFAEQGIELSINGVLISFAYMEKIDAT